MSYAVRLIMLYVRDLAASQQFYTTTLHASVAFSTDDFVALTLSDGLTIGLFDAARGLPPEVSATSGGFEIDIEVEDIEAAYKEWQEKQGATLTEIFDIPIGRQFYGKDPDGHCLAFYQLHAPHRNT